MTPELIQRKALMCNGITPGLCQSRTGGCRITPGILSHNAGTDTKLLQRKALTCNGISGPDREAVSVNSVIKTRRGAGLTPAPAWKGTNVSFPPSPTSSACRPQLSAPEAPVRLIPEASITTSGGLLNV